MKKLLCAVAALAMVAAFTSCNKKCTCKTYPSTVSVTMSLKDVQSTYASYGIDIKKCSDMSAVAEVNGTKTGVECK